MRSGARRGLWTGGAGGHRAGGRAWTRSSGGLRSFAPAPSISRPSTSTKRSTAGPWRTERRSRAATPGPRACCSYVGSSARRSAHRKKRARRPLPGLLLFQDGSKHAWLPQGPELDLVVTLDDATSAMLSAVLVEEEGTASSFVGLKETIAAHGLFSALYTDRGSHYFYTPKAGEPLDKTCLTQVGRAL